MGSALLFRITQPMNRAPECRRVRGLSGMCSMVRRSGGLLICGPGQRDLVLPAHGQLPVHLNDVRTGSTFPVRIYCSNGQSAPLVCRPHFLCLCHCRSHWLLWLSDRVIAMLAVFACMSGPIPPAKATERRRNDYADQLHRHWLAFGRWQGAEVISLIVFGECVTSRRS